MKEAILQDDKGWVFGDVQPTSTLTFDSRTFENDFKSDQDYIDNITSSRLYTFAIYIKKNQDLYYRSYMKIQDLLAQVGGVLKFIMFAFGLLCNYYNKIIREKLLINELFDWEENVSKINEKPIHKKDMKSSFNNFIINDNSKVHFGDNLGTGRGYDSVSKDFKDYKLLKQRKNVLMAESKMIIISQILFGKCMPQRLKLLTTAYEHAKKELKDRLDVKHYLELLESVNKLRLLVLNDEQNMCFDIIKKTNLFRDFTILNNDEKQKENKMNELEANVLIYFLKWFKNKDTLGHNSNDEKLYSRLPEIYKNFIKENCR